MIIKNIKKEVIFLFLILINFILISFVFALNLSPLFSSSNISNQNGITFLEVSSISPYISLQGLWEFENDNSTTAFDFSGNSLNGIFYGDAYSSEEVLYLDGQGDWVEVADNPLLNRSSSSSPFSICAKFNIAQHGETYSTIVGKYVPISGGRSFLLAKNNENNTYGFIYSVTGNDSLRIWSTYELNENQNYTLCGVYNGTSIAFYINGSLSGSADALAIYNNSDSPFIIGSFNESNEFNGTIDWVMYFNDSLNSTEIFDVSNNQSGRFINSGEIYFQTTSVDEGDVNLNVSNFYFSEGTNAEIIFDAWNLSLGYNETYPGLLGYWHFDSNFDDSSGNNLNGTAIGDVSVSQGVFNNSISINGTEDYLIINNFNESLLKDSLSFTGKIYLKSLPVSDAGIIGSTYPNSWNWIIRVDSSGHLVLRGWNGTASSITSTGVISLNNWTDIGITLNISSNEAIFYFNGRPESPKTVGFNSLYNGSNSDLQIGTYLYKFEDNRSINASLDELMLFNTTLSSEEIKLIHLGERLNWVECDKMQLSEGEIVATGYSFFDMIRPKLILNSDSAGSSTPSLLGDLILYFSQDLQINVLNNASVIIYPNNITYNITTEGMVSNQCWLSVNGTSNITMDKNSATEYGYFHSNISLGNHTIIFYCNNTEGDIFNAEYSFNLTKNISLVDESFVNSQGLRLYYNIYFDGETYDKGPVVIITDSWDSDKSNYAIRGEFFGNNGYLAIVLNTRGKGYSEGDRDAFGYECLDVYETIKEVKQKYSLYLNDTNTYIWGYSAGGGKAIVCSAKYPDYFTAAFSNSGVVNITKWYATAAQDDKDSMEVRIGFSPSENIEAYNSRDGTLLSYNTQAAIMAMHGTVDPRVNISIGRNLNTSLHLYEKEINYSEFYGVHEIYSNANAESLWWFNTHQTPVSIPSSGDLRIGGYLVNKNFSVEFIDDVGKYGTINYSLNNSIWWLNISAETYTNRTNVTLSTLPFDDYTIYDNGVNITTVINNIVTSQNSSYYVSISSGVIEFTLPHMSDHNITIQEDIDSIFPIINITSPINGYSSSFSGAVSVFLNVTASDASGISTYWYNVDDGENVTFDQNVNIAFSVDEGETEYHTIYVFVNDSSGNINSSSTYVTLTREVSEEESGSSGGSSGGSSSSSATTTNATQKTKTVVLTNIKSNQEINSPISVEGIYLTKLILESSKNISYASLKITVLDSDSISGLSSNNIYQGFQINKTGITNENINSVSLEFKVGKSWVDERNVSKIVLKRKQENSSEWEMLNTTLIGNDSTYYYFKSISSGFSLFAIYFDETLCIPEELFCSGNDLKLCSADRTSSVVEVCEYGCSEGKCLAQEELEQSEEFTFDVRTFFRNNLSIIFFVVIAMILLALIVVTFVLFKHVKKRR